MTKSAKFRETSTIRLTSLLTLALILGMSSQVRAQRQLPEITIVTAVSNMAFSAIWVAEQLNYFAEEGVRAKVTVAGGGSPCLSAVVGRSANFCATSSEGLILSRLEGAPLIAIQTHARNLTLSVTIRKAIAEKLGLTRESPLNDRIRVLTQLETIGAAAPGAVSEQIFKYLVGKIGGEPGKLRFAFLGPRELPSSLANNVIDAYALSPPSGEGTEAIGKGYVLIPLGRGEVPELTDYPYEVLLARPDFVEQNPKLSTAVARAISRGGALFNANPQAAKAALRAHRFYNPQRLNEVVFELSFSMVANAMPPWGDMTKEGWQKVINFSSGAGIIKDPAKAPSPVEGLLWTNKFVGKRP